MRPLLIRTVPPERRPEALRLLLSELPPADREGSVQRWLHDAAQQPDLLAGLLEARSGELLLGSVWGQPRPGRTAGLLPPRLVEQCPGHVAARLLEAATEWLDGQGVLITQVLVDDPRCDDAQLLERAGFRQLAELMYLISLDSDFPDAEPAGRLRFVPADSIGPQRLERLVDATYQQTRDCPALDGARSTADVLADYRAIGQYDPALWLVAQQEQRDIGCVLVNDHADLCYAELVYMGLVPEVRGQGWGVLLTRQAQWLARRLGRERLMLAVDANNVPALDVYSAAGFYIWQRRVALVRFAARAER